MSIWDREKIASIVLPSEIELSVNFLKGLKMCSGLGDEVIGEMAERAIDVGASHASDFVGSDVVDEALHRGVKVVMHKGGVVVNKLIRAQYDHSIKTIIIYEDGVTSVLTTPAAELLGVENTVESVREVLIWHEFFHVLEFKEIGLAGADFKVPGKTLWFERNKPLYQISEICANAFAMRAAGLCYSPFLIDYLAHNRELWE